MEFDVIVIATQRGPGDIPQYWVATSPNLETTTKILHTLLEQQGWAERGNTFDSMFELVRAGRAICPESTLQELSRQTDLTFRPLSEELPDLYGVIRERLEWHVRNGEKLRHILTSMKVMGQGKTQPKKPEPS